MPCGFTDSLCIWLSLDGSGESLTLTSLMVGRKTIVEHQREVWEGRERLGKEATQWGRAMDGEDEARVKNWGCNLVDLGEKIEEGKV